MSDAPSPVLFNSWAFWKPRVIRVSVIGSLAIAATQLLPEFPRDQEIEVRLSNGQLREVSITYLEDQRALTGATVKAGPSGNSAHHVVHLKDGEYTLQVDGQGEDLNGNSRSWQKSAPVTLSGEQVVIRLD